MPDKEPSRLKWDRYLDAPLIEERLRQPGCESAFSDQRATMDQLVRRLKPSSVACLGSGYLNDLPLQTLFEVANETYFIDWLPDVSSLGLHRRIIHRSVGELRCILCQCAQPERYCKAFSGSSYASMQVCTAFDAPEMDPVQCSNYTPGDHPHFVNADITSGRASRFGRRIFDSIDHSDSPKQAFTRAIRECRRCTDSLDPIPVKSNAFDFVTSSLVASQFDQEPYSYFARVLERKFGREGIEAKAYILGPLMEELRTELFGIQIEGHAAEIYRLLNKEHGRAYFSVEVFRSLSSDDDFFLVHGMPQLLTALERWFFFDFDALTPEKTLHGYTMEDGTSIVQGFLLRPKTEAEMAAA